jgi:protein-disulfide isomerase
MKRTRARPAVAAAPPARAKRNPKRTYDITLHATDRRMGNEKAKYALIEFSDFECPFCSRFHGDAYPKIVENYVDTGKVQYVFRDFPLGFHRKARGAHIAARCAGDQGQFWAMHHALFSNQKTLGPPLYTRTAGELKLDEDAFKRCTADTAVGAAVDKEMAAGRNYGVRGTPTFYVGEIKDGKIVNAKRLSGAQPFAKFAQYIDAALGTQTAVQ